MTRVATIVSFAAVALALAGTAQAQNARAQAAAARQPAELDTFHVQGNVYLIVGAASNVAVQIGDEGVLVVDTGGRATREQLLAAVRKLSDQPIRWIINTSADLEHTGGNETISQAGQTLNGNPAAIIAHENTLARMTAENRPITEQPLNTFFEEGRDFFFNGEAIFIYHAPGHSDGDIMVYFRGSDVLVAGDIFMTTQYPEIRLEQGGSVDAYLAGLNKILDVAVPKWLQEGGTYVIPGHGRVADEADVLDYRDMLFIVRARIASLVAEGKTLEQVAATKPAADYDPRYGNGNGGQWTTAKFVEAVYKDLKQKGGAK
ncbi:MAG TPA: MBL fold metallo-hydrolase [Gammaproteobacteria bacterium]|nr:MBL fold metallo-hydrolase [Gammaproteobacteria bacterium]